MGRFGAAAEGPKRASDKRAIWLPGWKGRGDASRLVECSRTSRAVSGERPSANQPIDSGPPPSGPRGDPRRRQPQRGAERPAKPRTDRFVAGVQPASTPAPAGSTFARPGRRPFRPLRKLACQGCSTAQRPPTWGVGAVSCQGVERACDRSVGARPRPSGRGSKCRAAALAGSRRRWRGDASRLAECSRTSRVVSGERPSANQPIDSGPPQRPPGGPAEAPAAAGGGASSGAPNRQVRGGRPARVDTGPSRFDIRPSRAAAVQAAPEVGVPRLLDRAAATDLGSGRGELPGG